MSLRVLLAAVAAATTLVACDRAVEAPFDEGVCFSVAAPEAEGGEPRFNILAEDQPQIESCAARLEEMRIRFLRLGGSNREVVGAYQGQFIFVDRRGVSFGRTLDGARFFALARTGDGRLAMPGAIQRDIDELGIVYDEPAPPPIPAG